MQNNQGMAQPQAKVVEVNPKHLVQLNQFNFLIKIKICFNTNQMQPILMYVTLYYTYYMQLIFIYVTSFLIIYYMQSHFK